MIRAYDDNGNVVDMVEWEQQIRADEKNKVIAKIKVKLGKVKTFEYETTEYYREIKYYNAEHVLEVLNNVLKGVE